MIKSITPNPNPCVDTGPTEPQVGVTQPETEPLVETRRPTFSHLQDALFSALGLLDHSTHHVSGFLEQLASHETAQPRDTTTDDEQALRDAINQRNHLFDRGTGILNDHQNTEDETTRKLSG